MLCSTIQQYKNLDYTALGFLTDAVLKFKGKEDVMPIHQLKNFLDRYGVKYTVISHSTAYTAQEVAQSTHTPGRELAKTVMIKVNGEMAMAVLPASYQVELDLLKGAIGAREVGLATEEEFRSRFPDCELGAMPPFGNLYGMEVFVDKMLTEDKEIAFNAGNHRELIRMEYRDFEWLVHPKIMSFCAMYAL